jgi:hypothetical protein
MRKFSLLIALVAAASISFAQEEGSGPDATPPTALQNLDWMVGEWETESFFSWGGSFLPLVATMKIDFDGQFIRTVGSYDIGGFVRTESYFIGHDDFLKEFSGYGFSNYSPKARLERGKVVDGKLIMECDMWTVAGVDGATRVTTWKGEDDTLMIKQEFKDELNVWEVAAESTYTRKKKDGAK